MQDWSKSLPSLSGSTDEAPKAPVQQMLGTPRRGGHIQCLGRDRRCFTSRQHCQHSQLRERAACNHSCALTLGAGAASNNKHRNSGAKEYRDIQVQMLETANSVSQTAPHQYKNKGSSSPSSSIEITFLKSCK